LSDERPNSGPLAYGELLAYLGGLGYSELYRRGEKRPSQEPRARPAERPFAAPPAAARAGRAPAPPAAPPPRGNPRSEGPRPEAPPVANAAGHDFGVPLPPAPPAAERARRLELLRQESLNCRLCRLCRGRTQVVYGDGFADAELMFIGEGPGAEEDRQGLPFVGAAGQLLTKIIQAIGLERSQVYIANVVKCRPPGNRDPEHDEIASCLPYLVQQIELVRPRLIVGLGKVAAHTLLHSAAPVSRLRGNWYKVAGADMRVTYHPAALLYDEGLKRPTWDDMKIVRDRLKELREQGPKV
jgi:uracil-DNA glycosylase